MNSLYMVCCRRPVLTLRRLYLCTQRAFICLFMTLPHVMLHQIRRVVI
jgi:hypothetical protein